jgi:calcium-dependent protein kinase
VDHPNIIKFHETYIDYRYVHIVMELAEGGELFEKIVEMHKFSE